MEIKLDKEGTLQEQAYFWLFKSLELQAHAARDPTRHHKRLADKALELALNLELAHWAKVPAATGGPHET